MRIINALRWRHLKTIYGLSFVWSTIYLRWSFLSILVTCTVRCQPESQTDSKAVDHEIIFQGEITCWSLFERINVTCLFFFSSKQKAESFPSDLWLELHCNKCPEKRGTQRFVYEYLHVRKAWIAWEIDIQFKWKLKVFNETSPQTFVTSGPINSYCFRKDKYVVQRVRK